MGFLLQIRRNMKYIWKRTTERTKLWIEKMDSNRNNQGAHIVQIFLWFYAHKKRAIIISLMRMNSSCEKHCTWHFDALTMFVRLAFVLIMLGLCSWCSIDNSQESCIPIRAVANQLADCLGSDLFWLFLFHSIFFECVY